MASIHKKSERKYKITVCNGYRSDGKKRVRSRTIDVPPDEPKRGILQYVYAQAEKEEKLLQRILQEPLLYRVYCLIAISTGLRCGEICALRWSDFHEDPIVTVRHSRSSVPGQGVQESSTKNHRSRGGVLHLMVYDYLGDLFREQILNGVNAGWDEYIFQTENGPVHPDSFSRHLCRISAKRVPAGVSPSYASPY